MLHICTSSRPGPLPPRSGRVRRLAPALVPALMLAAPACREDAESPTAPEARPTLDFTPAHVLAFGQVSAGVVHTCGVTTDNQAYCWGRNVQGELGNGTSTTPSLTPVAVVGGLRFRQMSAGENHTCGVTTENRAYCWGDNQFGELGDGTSTTHSLTPVAVAGGLLFRHVHTGGLHSCGVTTDNRAYCWGDNALGNLGDGTKTQRGTPVAVLGGLQFRQVTAGGDHNCGVTTEDRAYCWGSNLQGQLGAGTNTGLGQCGIYACSVKPVPVSGDFRFRHVSAGTYHNCSVTTDDRAYCWGQNYDGRLGDGTTTDRSTPVAVAGGHRFNRVSAGANHSCAVNPFDRAFCWGENRFGQLGDNTTTRRLTPVRVVGGHQFSQVSAGKYHHTCGVTTDDQAYCWGYNNFFGQLGDGTLKNRLRPVAVAGAS